MEVTFKSAPGIRESNKFKVIGADWISEKYGFISTNEYKKKVIFLTWNAGWNRRNVRETMYFGVFNTATVWSQRPAAGWAKVGKVVRWHFGFFPTYLLILFHPAFRAILPGQQMQVSREDFKKLASKQKEPPDT